MRLSFVMLTATTSAGVAGDGLALAATRLGLGATDGEPPATGLVTIDGAGPIAGCAAGAIVFAWSPVSGVSASAASGSASDVTLLGATSVAGGRSGELSRSSQPPCARTSVASTTPIAAAARRHRICARAYSRLTGYPYGLRARCLNKNRL